MKKSKEGLVNICTVHQPLLIPYIGLFNKIFHSDALFVLDNVQFRRRYFQNRNRIAHPSGDEVWLTVPIVARRTTEVRDVKISAQKWLPKFKRKIVHSYHGQPYFPSAWPYIERCLDRSLNDLTSKNIALLVGEPLSFELIRWELHQ